MPNRFQQLRDSLGNMDGFQEWDDKQPGNLEELNRAIQYPAYHRRQTPLPPKQMQGLLEERKRLMEAQAQQQFQQRLEQRLNPRIGTSEDTDPQAQMMFRIMQQMKRRYPGMQGGQPSGF